MSKNNQQSSEVNIVKEVVQMILYMIFICLVVWITITFIGQRTVVNGDSMQNTLHDQESLWVSKISYKIHDPERFDIVVFPYEDDSVYFIKRIIGMPGETVRIDEEGTIYINGEPLEENYGLETIDRRHIGRAIEDVKLGDDEYFVMGDNRNNSMDSRFEEVGNISRDKIEGKAVLRMWPLSKFGFIK